MDNIKMEDNSYALVEDDVVVNVIVWDGKEVLDISEEIVKNEGNLVIGSYRVDGVWHLPEEEEVDHPE